MTGSTLVFDEKKNRCILYGGRNVQEEMNLAMELDLGKKLGELRISFVLFMGIGK